MIDFTNINVIIGIVVALVIGLIFLIGHLHGKKTVQAVQKTDPLPTNQSQKIVDSTAHNAVINAISAVSNDLSDVKKSVLQIHEHLTRAPEPPQPELVLPAPEPPKAA